jgi:dolichyl-diphosphooligosaccharide--protein glycosyltransferase
MNKKLIFWQWAAAWLILAILSCYIRLYPLRSHMWDDAHEQATLLVIYHIKQTFLQQILSEAPNMPPALANHMAEEKLNETIHTDNQKFKEAIEKTTIALAHQPGAAPQKIYLLESDPYDFYNLTENIVNKGRIADIIKGSKYFNPLMCAPFGFWQPFTLHPYWGFIIYKTFQLFDPNIPLMSAVAYTPLLTYLIIIIAFLWVCRILNYSVIASFVGALFLIMAPINLKRGALGWYRTDPYNILFPLLLLGILFLALRPASKRDGFLWAVIFGLTLGVYALFWQGWGLLFFMGTACALSAAAFNFFIKKDKTHTRQNLLFIAIFIGATLLVVSMCFSFHDFFILFKEGFGELRKFTHRGLDLWPNLFMAVGELEKISLASITASAGGPIFILLALGGWFYSLRLAIQNFPQSRTVDTIILTIFLIVTLALSLHGERFVLFATIPLSVLAAAATHRFASLKSVGLPLAGLLTALILFSANRDIRTILTPIFNSTWDEALTKVKTDSPPDSIVNTWWAPGHFIKAIAHRSVPFDGASLDQGAVGYWMANMFLSQDEKQARGILRMLNTSGNHAADFLVKCGLKLSDATTLLLAIASENTSEAAQTLKGIISDDQIHTLLSMTHGKNPHSYVLVYTELVDDNLMLAFTGRWNIKKIEEINANPEMLKDVPPLNSPDFINYLWGTMGGPPKYSDALPLLGQDRNQLVFRENLTIDLNTMDAKIQSPQYGEGQPASVFYLKDGKVMEHENPDGNLNYSVVLYQDDGQYVARLMDHPLANSLIMKLYYFDGQGLQYFKPLILSHDLTGRTRIKVFKVIY